jgi:uncharacterized protein (DUF2267 family)
VEGAHPKRVGALLPEQLAYRIELARDLRIRKMDLRSKHDVLLSKIGAKSNARARALHRRRPEDDMPYTIAQRLQDACGLDEATAARLASAVIQLLADQLPAPDRSRFIARLPAGVARPGAPAGSPSGLVARFYEQVAALAEVPVPRATEIAQVVCAALAARLDADTRAWLEARLPTAFATLLTSRESPSRPPVAPSAVRRYATLAEGKPGSMHPLSDARVDRAHRESVARSADPHLDTKLSSTSGPTQAREHETLADADPRPARPISTSKQ